MKLKIETQEFDVWNNIDLRKNTLDIIALIHRQIESNIFFEKYKYLIYRML